MLEHCCPEQHSGLSFNAITLLTLGRRGEELIFILKVVCTFSAGKGRYCANCSHNHPERLHPGSALASRGSGNCLMPHS